MRGTVPRAPTNWMNILSKFDYCRISRKAKSPDLQETKAQYGTSRSQPTALANNLTV